MAERTRSLEHKKAFLIPGLLLALPVFFMAPAFAFAQTYGGSTYGAGVYGTGYVAPAASSSSATSSSSGGGGLIVGSGPLAPGYINTNTTPSSTAATSSTQTRGGSALSDSQVQSIVQLLQAFGAEQSVIDKVIASLHGQPAAGSASGSVFTRDLELGMTGDDVTALQQYLNAHGFMLAESGPGSPGNETKKFGGATKYQLAQFQKANKITPASGYFGPKTRAFVGQ